MIGIYPHEKMEVYAMGFRNQSGVTFGPKGTKWENALAVSDNGANDVGHRRVANGAEKLWIVTEKGQDGGFPTRRG
jgi:glucose/arabinose dehydrogenase